MRIKICGITQRDQGQAIAQTGVTDLGFICVTRSPRYVSPSQIQSILQDLPSSIHTIGVFVNPSLAEIQAIVETTGLTGVQLHGEESPAFCQALRQQLPGVELWKAFRLKTPESLTLVEQYQESVDVLLLDAYHPQQYGGTGVALNWSELTQFSPPLPWFLAGGLTPDNIVQALSQLHPQGIDLSSGVERSPGDKDLAKVSRLFQQLAESRIIDLCLRSM